MVFDAHEKAFAFFGGACVRGIYDNMRTAVDGVFPGKDRAWNARFLRMCSHHLVEPTAYTPDPRKRRRQTPRRRLQNDRNRTDLRPGTAIERRTLKTEKKRLTSG